MLQYVYSCLVETKYNKKWRDIRVLPIERLNQINEIIHRKKSIKISELSKELSVSEMTIHRDIKPLIEDGTIAKTFGGITLISKNDYQETNKSCIICHRDINEKMAYRIILADSKIEHTCCAHCGLLRHHQLGEDVRQAICYDYLKLTTINAKSAVYVMNTTIDMGCCQPQVLAFELKKHALSFIKGFGGEVLSFHEATDAVIKEMNGNGQECH